MMNFKIINGMRVYESVNAVTLAPRVEHEKRRSMSDSYHNRVQKKWNKRFGMAHKPGCFQVGGAFFMHPELIRQLRVGL